MIRDWQDLSADQPVEVRAEAIAVCGLASDRAAGKPVEVAADVLRAAAAAEGLDTSQP